MKNSIIIFICILFFTTAHGQAPLSISVCKKDKIKSVLLYRGDKIMSEFNKINDTTFQGSLAGLMLSDTNLVFKIKLNNFILQLDNDTIFLNFYANNWQICMSNYKKKKKNRYAILTIQYNVHGFNCTTRIMKFSNRKNGIRTLTYL